MGISPDLYLLVDRDGSLDLTIVLLSYFIEFFDHLRLCLAIAIHNLKLLKITHIC